MVPSLNKRPISSLTYEEMEKLCEIAEEAAREYITSKVPSEYISNISISVDLEGSESLNVEVDVEAEFSPLYKKVNVKEIVEGSVKAALDAIEKYLDKIRS